VAEFYAAILDRPVPASGREAYNFEVEGVNLLIHPLDDQPPEPGWPEDVDHIAFEVEDLNAECERLAAAGYEVKGPTQFPWGRSAYLYDPDGRMVELHGPDIVYG
jgi:catechol 2,3-dioxygenase-like lactoylglutathione lyase family enzyme